MTRVILATSIDYGETSTMLRTMRWTGILMTVGLITGCAHMYDCCDEHRLKWRCCHEAKMAWLRCRDLYADVCSFHDFGMGFRAGYESVCMGGNGCPPAMPPRNYWSSCCLHEEGHCEIMAWYDGFHHGVLAAQCDGCEGRCNILCAQDVYGHEPCNVDYNEMEFNVQPQGEYGSELTPVQMPGDVLSPPPVPMVPEYSPPPAGGIYGDEYGSSMETNAPTIPGLRDMLNQNAVAEEYPTF